MSFRKEIKLKIDKEKLLSLLEWVYSNNGKKLYPTRTVSSTYLDNDALSAFHDSEEGTVPRRKIRLRSYTKENHSENSTLLEMKISSVEGRFKTTTSSFNLGRIIRLGYYDLYYGVLKPVVRVTYDRDYYRINQVRLTIDKNIEYTKNGQKSPIRDSDIIVEVKAPNDVPWEWLERKFPFEKTRFSKYSRAIQLCYY